ncbi:MAG: FAD-binding oxidoreductase [Candidatus Zixiibacteriota bacterium]
MNLATQLRQLINPVQVIDNPTALIAASIDESSLAPVTPSAIVQVRSVTEIQSVVKFCYERSIPLTVRAAGSALEGSAIPCKDGVVLDVSGLDKVVHLWPEDLQVQVEPGIIYEKLNEVLKRESLFFPPSPGGSSDVATIGGMVSTNASGIYSVKYGGTKQFVLEMDIVDGTGKLHRLGNRAIKRSSGYNLIDLIAGSEGTLGVITSVTLQLRGIPEGSRKIAFKFKSEIEAAQAVSEMMRYGLDLAAVEFLDRNVIEALNLLNNYGLEEVPCLFLEVHGPDPVLTATSESALQIAVELSGQILQLASGQNPWEIRHFVTNAIKLRRPGYTIIRNDAAFPISELPGIVQYCRQLSDESGLLIHAFGHVGMGLIHALILARRDDEAEWQMGLDVNRKIILKAIEVGGTISGEHGIGLGHKAIFGIEHSGSLDLMRQIKRVFDPKGILNPGKIFDAA